MASALCLYAQRVQESDHPLSLMTAQDDALACGGAVARNSRRAVSSVRRVGRGPGCAGPLPIRPSPYKSSMGRVFPTASRQRMPLSVLMALVPRLGMLGMRVATARTSVVRLPLFLPCHTVALHHVGHVVVLFL